MMLGDASLPTTARILASRHLNVLGGAAQFIVYTCAGPFAGLRRQNVLLNSRQKDVD